MNLQLRNDNNSLDKHMSLSDDVVSSSIEKDEEESDRLMASPNILKNIQLIDEHPIQFIQKKTKIVINKKDLISYEI